MQVKLKRLTVTTKTPSSPKINLLAPAVRSLNFLALIALLPSSTKTKFLAPRSRTNPFVWV